MPFFLGADLAMCCNDVQSGYTNAKVGTLLGFLRDTKCAKMYSELDGNMHIEMKETRRIIPHYE